MSNSSNNNRFNTSRDRSFYANTNTEGNTTKDTFLKNGSNIIMKDYSNFAAPKSSLIGGRDNESYNPYVMDSKIKDLESKLITLEQANKILVERINNNEKQFAVQLKQIEIVNAEERENRYKTEKAMNIISEQSNANSNDLNMKINMIQERMIKGDESKTQQRQFDLESQKYLIGKLTEKITKTVKSEVEARYKADMDGKMFSQKLSNKFESSLDILKKEIEEITNQTRVEMQNISRECSERTHNVSKYIDQQIQDAVFGKGSSNEELKNFVRKLTEQVKTSLISISKKNEMIETRLNNLENKDDNNKKEYKNYMDFEQNRIMKKINDVKLFTEINISRHSQYLEQSIGEVISKIENNIQFLAGQLIDTRNKINERFEKIFEEHHDQYKKICEDMQEICNRLYKYESLLQNYEQKYNDVRQNVDKSLANVYAREDVQIVQERIIKTIECNFLQEQINSIHNALQTSDVQFKENMNELNKGSKDSYQFLDNQLKLQEKKMLEIAQNNLNMFEEIQKSSDNIEVKQMVDEMIAKVDNIIVMESIQKSKNAEYNIMQTIEENKNNILNSIKEINNNKQDISVLKDQVSTIQTSLDTSGQNMSGMADQMKKMREEAKELEMKESVNKIMDSMITNIETILTKEKMDKMSQFDLNKMRESIIDLENKYDSLSNTNTELETIKENINQLNAETEILKNKPKGGDDIKLATIQMLNNVEFDNIYSILNSGEIGSKEQVNMKDYNEMVDNKINNALEKIKKDNENMWIKCVQIKNKVTDPEEIKKILNEMGGGVYNTSESKIGIMELNSLGAQNYPTAKVNLDPMINYNNENYDYGSNYNNQQDPGPEINSKKSSKKSGKKGKSDGKKEANNQEGSIKNNINNEEKKSSKISNKNKSGVQSVNEENKSKKSKVSSQNKNGAEPVNEENKSKKSKVSGQNKDGAEPVNEENKSKKSKKSIKNKEQENVEQSGQESNNEQKSKKSSKNDKINSNSNENPPEKEAYDMDSGGPNGKEGEEEEEDEGEEGGEIEDSGGEEELPGELKSKNEVSGKSKPK